MGFALYTECCPQCGGILWVQEHTTLRDMYAECLRCGMNYESLCYPQEYYDGMIVEGAYEEVDYKDYWKEKGYGVVCITYEDGYSDFFRIEGTPDVKQITSYLAMLDHEYVDKDKSYLTLWNEERQNVIAIFGSRPPDFEYSRAF